MFDWILGVIVAGGLIGVAMLMLAENLAPPIPSEVIMPLAGYAAAQGLLSFPGVVGAGTAGALAGAWFWYGVGRGVRPARLRRFVERHGRWLTLDLDDLERSERLFRRRGAWAVFFGRLIPGVRTFVSVPAGLLRMPQPAFVFWTLLGTALWTFLLAGAGYLLEAQHHRVEGWLDPVGAGVLALVVGLYVWRVVRYRRRA